MLLIPILLAISLIGFIIIQFCLVGFLLLSSLTLGVRFVALLGLWPSSLLRVSRRVQPGAQGTPDCQNNWDEVFHGPTCTQELDSTTALCARGELVTQRC